MSTPIKVLVEGVGPQREAWEKILREYGFQVLSLEACHGEADVQYALEVTNRDVREKKQRVQKMDRILPAHIPLLVSTLSISATEVASWTQHPQRVCGFGTFLPLEERNLIEYAPALQTDSSILERVNTFFSLLGKESERVQDEVGLVFPRILSLIINEAVFALTDGVAEAGDIDLGMKLGTNYPHGPLQWADQIGLDEVYSVIHGLHRELNEERYRPAPLLRKMVLAGWLGERTGKGFYTYGTAKEKNYVEKC